MPICGSTIRVPGTRDTCRAWSLDVTSTESEIACERRHRSRLRRQRHDEVLPERHRRLCYIIRHDLRPADPLSRGTSPLKHESSALARSSSPLQHLFDYTRRFRRWQNTTRRPGTRRKAASAVTSAHSSTRAVATMKRSAGSLVRMDSRRLSSAIVNVRGASLNPRPATAAAIHRSASLGADRCDRAPTASPAPTR